MKNSTNIFADCSFSGYIKWDHNFSNKLTDISSVTTVVFHILIIPFVVFLNGATILLVAKYETLREERFVVLGLLSITHLFCGLVSQPLFIAKELYHLITREVNCKLDTTFYLISELFLLTSFYQLIILTYERYVAITDPYTYPQRLTVRKLVYLALANWAIHVTAVIIDGTTVDVHPYHIFVMGAKAFVFCILFFYWNAKILAIINRQNRAIEGNITVETERNRRNIIANRKLTYTAVLLMGSFAMCYFPFFGDLIYSELYYSTDFRKPPYFAFHPWVDVSIHINSLFSPLIYGFRTKEFRKYFVRYFFGIRRNSEIVSINMVSARNGELTSNNQFEKRETDQETKDAGC